MTVGKTHLIPQFQDFLLGVYVQMLFSLVSKMIGGQELCLNQILHTIDIHDLQNCGDAGTVIPGDLEVHSVGRNDIKTISDFTFQMALVKKQLETIYVVFMLLVLPPWSSGEQKTEPQSRMCNPDL
jgi:hypothetical protein